jgi:hypothetical protein
MRTALEACVEVRVGPASSTGDDRHTMITEGDEEGGGRMGKFFEVGGEVAGLDHMWWLRRRPKWGRNADVAGLFARAYLMSHLQICNAYYWVF